MTQELSAAKQLEKLQAAIENYRHGRNTLSPSGRLNKYKSEFVKGKKKVKGKWVWWDEKLKKAFDKKAVEKSLFHETIGTTSPLKDVKYLEAKVKHDAKVNQGPDPLRTKLSHKVSGSDTTVYESNWKDSLTKSESSLNKLRSGTSFARQDKAQASENLLATLDNEIKEKEAKVFPEKKQKNNNTLSISGQEVGRGTWVNGRWVDQGTSKPLMSSFKENASDQARHNLKVKQDAGETTYKSDVFTIDPNTGEALGVMTRSQRRQWDADNQDHLKKWSKENKDKLRVYKNTGGMMGAYERTGAG